MQQIYVFAQNKQDAPVCIGPFKDGINDELYSEIESWGWTVLSGYVPKMSLAQARREAKSGG